MCSVMADLVFLVTQQDNLLKWLLSTWLVNLDHALTSSCLFFYLCSLAMHDLR
jgi:hypothetical protein